MSALQNSSLPKRGRRIATVCIAAVLAIHLSGLPAVASARSDAGAPVAEQSLHEERALTAIRPSARLESEEQAGSVDGPPPSDRPIAETQSATIERRLLSSTQSSAEAEGHKSWWVLGSLVAAAGALAVVLFSGGGQDDDSIPQTALPEPPGLPED